MIPGSSRKEFRVLRVAAQHGRHAGGPFRNRPQTGLWMATRKALQGLGAGDVGRRTLRQAVGSRLPAISCRVGHPRHARAVAVPVIAVW